MEVCTATDPIRVIGLGNDLLGDDAVGLIVARQVRERASGRVPVVETIESGLRLLDYLTGAERVVVVDAVQTGTAPPGTLYRVEEEDIEKLPGGSPHYVGLFETLQLGRALGLPVPGAVTVVAVETHDCTTVGGPIDPAVHAAIPGAIRCVEEVISGA
jgi:hydrogenase maturation protease